MSDRSLPSRSQILAWTNEGFAQWWEFVNGWGNVKNPQPIPPGFCLVGFELLSVEDKTEEDRKQRQDTKLRKDYTFKATFQLPEGKKEIIGTCLFVTRGKGWGRHAEVEAREEIQWLAQEAVYLFLCELIDTSNPTEEEGFNIWNTLPA